MYQKFFDNYEAFYTMVISTTIMSNTRSPKFDEDSEKIIKFISDAYSFDEQFSKDAAKVIIGDLSLMSRMGDFHAFKGSIQPSSEVDDALHQLYEIKGDVFISLKMLSKVSIDGSWFDYSMYKLYEPARRAYQIRNLSSFGNLTTTRQMGILYALGIGVPKDYELAQMRLTQSALWGDIPSMHLLSHVYHLAGNEEKSKLMAEVAQLCHKYLMEGCTVLPDEVKKNFSEEACRYFAYISSIKQDIINASNAHKINFSFLEAVMSDKLDFFKRMDYINNYSAAAWKDLTNSSIKSTPGLGF